MKYNEKNKPIECIMRNSTNYKNGEYAKPVGVLVHSTGANNPRISRYCQPSTNDPKYNELIALIGKNNNRNSWNEVVTYAGVNGWIGKLADGTIASTQSLPWNMSPWGCADGWNGSCNLYNGMHWIQYEICEADLDDKAYFEATYKEACELTAYLCKLYNIDPHGTVKCGSVNVPTVLCHRDSYDYGMGSSHSDVRHWWSRYGVDMDDFRKDVAALMKTSTETLNSSSTAPTLPSSPIYRIRKTWADAKSQKGAYSNLESAKKECDKHPGYNVFDESGKLIYTAKTKADAKKEKVVVPNITYAVKTKSYGILPDVKNRTDCAGYKNSEIVAIKIGVDSGSIKYRVHTVKGKWLGWVTGADWNDFNNGYAGDDKNAIDAIEVVYTTDTKKTGGKVYRAKYQVKAKGKTAYWSNQYNNETKNGQDGYAGAFGSPIVEVKMNLE